jgi:hypothetical protein
VIEYVFYVNVRVLTERMQIDANNKWMSAHLEEGWNKRSTKSYFCFFFLVRVPAGNLSRCKWREMWLASPFGLPTADSGLHTCD